VWPTLAECEAAMASYVFGDEALRAEDSAAMANYIFDGEAWPGELGAAVGNNKLNLLVTVSPACWRAEFHLVSPGTAPTFRSLTQALYPTPRHDTPALYLHQKT
jgi:hypothetical protein